LSNDYHASYSYTIADFQQIKLKMLNWSKQFNIFCWLDNHQYTSSTHQYECLLAVGAKRIIQANAGNAIAQLKDFSEANPSWLFGHLGYDLKNETEKLSSGNFDGIGFPDLCFFEPEIVVELNQQQLIIHCVPGQEGKVYQAILECPVPPEMSPAMSLLHIQSRISKEEYIATIRQLLKHIQKGDCYEINFCQEFYAETANVNPLAAYLSLSRLSPNPFSAFYRLDDKYLCCASPERYLKKTGQTLLSQPIKGTMSRNRGNDADSRRNLYQSEKDRAENVMVVDLVRNDLSRVCTKASVQVDELFGVYTFPQVHQMISTISGQLRDDLHWTDAIKASFPMGSMTGAPKKKVMELIEQYESTRRGIFSGAVGYITPRGDFDFNVVIRSILYNQTRQYLSFPAGSGITAASEPVKEYDECMLKAAAMRKVLQEGLSNQPPPPPPPEN
jgi:para-aminobenzoate synthetase component I